MEKLTEFLKKNWIWVLVAIVVIAYLLYRRKKTSESLFKAAVASPRARANTPSLPEATWKKPGWFELRGPSSAYAWLKKPNIAYVVGVMYYYFSNGTRGAGRWEPRYPSRGGIDNDARQRNLSFKFGATSVDRIFGYWYYDCRENKTVFCVKKIVSWGGVNTFDFSGDTWANGMCASPTNLDGGESDMKVFPELILEGASLVRVG